MLRDQHGRGYRIPEDTLRDLEAGFGQPLSGCRIHTDPAAALLARQLEARAFTAGQDIYFAEGAYDPVTSPGYRLLAHELTHTLQQRPVTAASRLPTVDPAAASTEPQAELVSDRLFAQQQRSRREPIAPVAVVPVCTVTGGPVIQRQVDPSINQSLPEVNQSFLEDPEAEIKQSLPEEPSTSPIESAPEEGLRPEEAETLKRIRDLASQAWVGPFDEGKIEALWGSFGDRLSKIAGGNLPLWLRCLDVGAELDALPQITLIQDQFVDDIKQTVSDYLNLNRQVVLDELRRLGLPATASPVPTPNDVRAGQIREIQSAATSLAKLQTAQAQARKTYVGYQLLTSADPIGGMSTVWSPSIFDPYAPPQFEGSLGEGILDRLVVPGVRVPIKSYQELKEKYDEASAAISGMLLRYPALFAFSRELSSASTATVSARFAADPSPRQAFEQLATALRQVQQDIYATQAKLNRGDLNPLDLTPIHQQLFAGRRSESGVDWSQTLPRWAATERIGDHTFDRALQDLGLQTAAAALFLLAPFTGGASLYLMVAGLAVSGAKFYISQQQYESFAEAANTGVTPGTELVTPQQVEAAEQFRDADAIALALAAVAVGAAAAGEVIGAIRGPRPDVTSAVPGKSTPVGPVPSGASNTATAAGGRGPSANILVVGAETEAEFAYATDAAARGHRVTVVNPQQTAPARAFVSRGGTFVESAIEEALPAKPSFTTIREDFPFPLGRAFQPTVDFAAARIDRLLPGGHWIVVTEQTEFATTLEAAATRGDTQVSIYRIPLAHEGTPVSPWPKEPNRFVVIIEKVRSH